MFGIVPWDFGSGRVCNRWETAVGFKWRDSQLISSHVDPFSIFFFDFGDFRIVFDGDAVSRRSQDPPRLS